MTYGKIIKPGASPTYQCRIIIDKERKISCEGSWGTGRRIWYFQAPSLSLCKRGRRDWERGSRSGYKDCLYGEAIQESDQSTSKICKEYRAKLERDSDPSAGSLFAKRSEAWLRGENVLERSSWNTAMTGCHQKRSCTLIGFWSLKRSGDRVIEMLV